jgi:hypothetical protein
MDIRARLADALRAHQHCDCEQPAHKSLHQADVLLSLPGIAIVELPSATEFTEQGKHWNVFPFVKQLGEDIKLGANCEYVYVINKAEAREVAAALLAAAVQAQEQHEA